MLLSCYCYTCRCVCTKLWWVDEKMVVFALSCSHSTFSWCFPFVPLAMQSYIAAWMTLLITVADENRCTTAQPINETSRHETLGFCSCNNFFFFFKVWFGWVINMLVPHSWQKVCLNNCLLKLAKQQQSDKTEMSVYFACKYILLNGNIDIIFWFLNLYLFVLKKIWETGSGGLVVDVFNINCI